MGEKEIVKALMENLRRKPEDWKFIQGKTVLTRDQMIEKINNDGKFRKFIVGMVEGLSVDLLLRKSE